MSPGRWEIHCSIGTFKYETITNELGENDDLGDFRVRNSRSFAGIIISKTEPNFHSRQTKRPIYMHPRTKKCEKITFATLKNAESTI